MKRWIRIAALLASVALGALSACSPRPAEKGASFSRSAEGGIPSREPTFEVVVRFETGGGSPIGELRLSAGTLVDLSQAVTVKGEERFCGWYFDEALTVPATERIVVQSDLTLYAKWETPVPEYTLSFDTAGGSFIAPARYRAGETVSAPEPPVRKDYVFEGWYAEESCVNRYTFPPMPENDVTVYAKWRELQRNILVRMYGNCEALAAGSVLSATFDEADEPDLSSAVEEFQRQIALALAAVYPEADLVGNPVYLFVGWSYDAAGNLPFDGKIPASENGLDLYAQWTRSPAYGASSSESATKLSAGFSVPSSGRR